MKLKILGCLVAVAGALLISATDGYTKSNFGNNVNDACAPATPFTGDCTLCHASNYGTTTAAMTAYSAGGTTLTDFFCPTSAPPPPASRGLYGC